MPSVLSFFPPPEFVRRTMLYGDTVAFRANHLNPPAIWGKEVPRSKEWFGFGLHLAPIESYLPCLEETQHLPIDTPPADINYYPAPGSKAMCYWDGTIRATAKDLKSSQEVVALKTYTHIREQHPEMDIDDVLSDLTARMQIPRTSVRHLLKSQGVALPTSEVAGNIADSKLHKFDRNMEYHYMLLGKVVQQCRSAANNAKIASTFTLTDIAVSDAPGGYPLRCPVLGVKLDWGLNNHRSWYSPRVGRYDPAQPFIQGNVLLMSHLAKKLLEGKKFHTTVLELEVAANPDMPTALTAWSKQHPVPDTDAVTNFMRLADARASAKAPTPERKAAQEAEKATLQAILDDDWSN